MMAAMISVGETAEARVHALHLPADDDARAARQVLAGAVHDLLDRVGHRAEVRPLDVGLHVERGHHVVVGDVHRRRVALHRREVPQDLGRHAAGEVDRRLAERLQRVHLVLRCLDGDRVLNPLARVEPEARGDLAAGAERDQRVVGDVALGEPLFAGLGAVDVHPHLGLVDHLRDVHVHRAAHVLDLVASSDCASA